MDCREALERLYGREAGEPLPDHVLSCPSCRGEAAWLEGLEARVREAGSGLGVDRGALRRRVLRPRIPIPWRWAAAAAVLLAVAALLLPLSRSSDLSSFSASPAPRPPTAQALGEVGRLELSPGGEVERLPGEGGAPPRIALRAGACWLEAEGEVVVEAPLNARIAPGSRLEIRWLEPPSRLAFSWLTSAEATEQGPDAELSVVVGEARVGELHVRGGSRLRVSGRRPVLAPLAEGDLARIEGWRSRRLEGAASRRYGPQEVATMSAGAARVEGDHAVLASPGRILLPVPGPRLVLTAELRRLSGHVLLSYPVAGGMAETALGNLPAWEGEAWHRLTVSSGPGGVEVFLDGRELLRSPARSREGLAGPALGVQGGSMEIHSLAAEADE